MPKMNEIDIRTRLVAVQLVRVMAEQMLLPEEFQDYFELGLTTLELRLLQQLEEMRK